MGDPRGDGPFVDADEIGLPPVEGLEPPTVSEPAYTLNDEDASNCRNIGAAELVAGYVDSNIVTTEPLQLDFWLDPANLDAQDLSVGYSDGRQLAIKLGSIGLAAGPWATEFTKRGGIIYPVDAGGQVLLDATNTPTLSWLRRHLHEQLAQLAGQRLEIAMIVGAFASAVSGLGGGMSNTDYLEGPAKKRWLSD